MNKRLFAVSAALGVFVASPAQAGYTIDVQQDGSNVVALGSGSINLDALTFYLTDNSSASMLPPQGLMIVGSGPYSLYGGGFTGPVSFGDGELNFASSVTGGMFAIRGAANMRAVVTPLGYVSGADLGPSTATWNGATFASLGLTPGTYVWNWGQGASADSFTVRIGNQVPEPATWAMMLLGFGLAGGAIRAAKRKSTATVVHA